MQQFDDARGRAGQEAGQADHQPADVFRVEAVHVLARIERLDDRLLADAVRQR